MADALDLFSVTDISDWFDRVQGIERLESSRVHLKKWYKYTLNPLFISLSLQLIRDTHANL